MTMNTQAILFIFSVQHDCRLAKCPTSALCPQLQERRETTWMQHLVDHADDNHFLINLYGLHNANMIRSILPRHLYAPQPLYSDWKAHHIMLAGKLRVTQKNKRAATQAKRKATIAAKKAKKLAEQRNPEMSGSEGSNSDNDTTDQEENAAGVRLQGRKRRRK